MLINGKISRNFFILKRKASVKYICTNIRDENKLIRVRNFIVQLSIDAAFHCSIDMCGLSKSFSDNPNMQYHIPYEFFHLFGHFMRKKQFCNFFAQLK